MLTVTYNDKGEIIRTEGNHNSRDMTVNIEVEQIMIMHPSPIGKLLAPELDGYQLVQTSVLSYSFSMDDTIEPYEGTAFQWLIEKMDGFLKELFAKIEPTPPRHLSQFESDLMIKAIIDAQM